MHLKQPQKITVIGGGTGTYTVLSGLKKYPPDLLDLSAVVTVADSGGSTGVLRDEFGYLPVGDFRMALTALADDNDTGDVLRKLFLYRFNKGNGLSGHNFGNLFLVAMTDVFGSEEKAIELASRILRVRGKVLPVSNEKLTLAARFADGEVVRGESAIDEPEGSHDGREKIEELWIEPQEAKITKRAQEAIEEAHMIILGPGDLYTSILANIAVPGVKESIGRSKAEIIYIVNLMTKYGQTHSFTASQHVDEIEHYMGKIPHYVMMNDTSLSKEVLQDYEAQYEYPVRSDLKDNAEYKIIKGDFLAQERVVKPSGDLLKRSLIRHDSDKLARAIVELL